MIEVRQAGIQVQIDRGANSNIFGNISYFHTFTPKRGNIQQVTREVGSYKEFGIVLTMIGNQMILLMKDNLQNTLSPTEIKKYNDCRSARMEALDWMRVTDHEGKFVRTHTN